MPYINQILSQQKLQSPAFYSSSPTMQQAAPAFPPLPASQIPFSPSTDSLVPAGNTIQQLLQTVVVALQNIIALIANTVNGSGVGTDSQPLLPVTTESVALPSEQAVEQKKPNLLERVSGWLEKAGKIGKGISQAWDKGKQFWNNIKDGAAGVWNTIKSWFSGLF